MSTLVLVFLVGGALVLATALLLDGTAPRVDARSRHTWLVGAFAWTAALPLLSLLAPTWNLHRVEQRPPSVVGVRPVADYRPTAVGSASPGATTPVASPIGGGPSPSRADPLLFLWLLGAGLVSARRFGAHLRVARLVRRAAPAPPAARHEVAALAARGGPRVPVGVLRSSETDVPFAWGLRRPVIVLPEALAQEGGAARRLLLAHEVEHLRRHDLLARGLAHLVCALRWFDPLAWLAERRLVCASELACDRAAADQADSAPAYAAALLGAAARASRVPPTAVVAGVRAGGVEGRIDALLRGGSPRAAGGALRWGLLGGVALLGAGARVGIAGPGPAAPQEPRWSIELSAPLALEGIESIDAHVSRGAVRIVAARDGGARASLRAAVDPEEVAPEELGREFSDHLGVTTDGSRLLLRDRHLRDGDQPWTLELTLELPRPLAARLEVGVGDVRVERAGGRLEAVTGNGDVDVELGEARLEVLHLSAGGGDVRAELESAPPTTTLHTGVGDVTLSTSSPAPAGEIELSTGSGEVLLRLPSGARGSLRARAPRIHLPEGMGRPARPGRPWDLELGGDGPGRTLSAGVGGARVEWRR